MSEHTSPTGKSTGAEGAVVAFLKQRWLAIVLVLVAVVFILQNRGPVAIHLLWIELTSPMWMFLALLFLGGFVAGMLFKRRRKNR